MNEIKEIISTIFPFKVYPINNNFALTPFEYVGFLIA